jgi:hypothetical protein
MASVALACVAWVLLGYVFTVYVGYPFGTLPRLLWITAAGPLAMLLFAGAALEQRSVERLRERRPIERAYASEIVLEAREIDVDNCYWWALSPWNRIACLLTRGRRKTIARTDPRIVELEETLLAITHAVRATSITPAERLEAIELLLRSRSSLNC